MLGINQVVILKPKTEWAKKTLKKVGNEFVVEKSNSAEVHVYSKENQHYKLVIKRPLDYNFGMVETRFYV